MTDILSAIGSHPFAFIGLVWAVTVILAVAKPRRS